MIIACKEREINKFCVVLFHHEHNVVVFLGKRKISFKHLIASSVEVEANSPWGETGSYRQVHLGDVFR